MAITLEDKPEIEYPCKWGYRLIGKDKDTMHSAAKSLLGVKPHTIKHGNQSSKGTFVSLHLELVVDSEDERIYLYEEFKKQECFLYVL